MKYYKGYPIVVGRLLTKSSIIAHCPYCSRIEHFNYNKNCTNPTKRRSHCINDSDFYYIYLKGGERNAK